MYLNLIQIAESFGVAEAVVEGWVKEEGMPHTPDRGRLLFDRAQVVEWAAARGLVAKAGFLTPEPAGLATGCRLEPLLRAGGIWRDVPPEAVFDVLGRAVAALPGATAAVRQLVAQRLREPGGVTWAPIGGGLALPHPSTRVSLGRDSGMVALLRLRSGLAQAGPTPDAVPVTCLWFFLAPSPRAHLELLGRLTRALMRGPLRAVALASDEDAAILEAARAADLAFADAGRGTMTAGEGGT